MPIAKQKYKLTRVLVEAAPDEPGVYALWEDDELVFLGHASRLVTIRACLRLQLARSLCPCAEKATHYSWALSLRPAERELELLQEFQAQFGRLPRCNEDAA
jgi:hypothetical protein